jgi:hypothetical protein
MDASATPHHDPADDNQTTRIHHLAGPQAPARCWSLLARFAPCIIRSRMCQARDEAITPPRIPEPPHSDGGGGDDERGRPPLRGRPTRQTPSHSPAMACALWSPGYGADGDLSQAEVCR